MKHLAIMAFSVINSFDDNRYYMDISCHGQSNFNKAIHIAKKNKTKGFKHSKNKKDKHGKRK